MNQLQHPDDQQRVRSRRLAEQQPLAHKQINGENEEGKKNGEKK